MPPQEDLTWPEWRALHNAEADRRQALRGGLAQQRAVQDMRRTVQDMSALFGGQAGPSPGEAAAQVADPARPAGGVDVQGRLPHPAVPMDEEDSLPSSAGSLSQEDMAALENGQEPDDEPQVISVGPSPSTSGSGHLSSAERKRARAAEKKKAEAERRKADKMVKIGYGTPAPRGTGRPLRGRGKHSRGGRSRHESGPDFQVQQAPAPHVTPSSPLRAFPMLPGSSPSPRPFTPPPSTSGVSVPVLPAGAERQGDGQLAGDPPALEQEDAQAADDQLGPHSLVPLPHQDIQLARLEVSLT